MLDVSARERRMVIGAAVSVAALGLWVWVIKPSLEMRDNSLVRLSELSALSAQLDRLPSDPRIETPGAQPPLRQRVTETARNAGVGIRRLDPQGAALSVTLEDVAFTTLIGWLDTLTSPQQVRLLGAEIARRPEPGIVSVRLTLEGG